MLVTELPSGLKVLVQENHASKVVAIQVWVRVGSADETEDEAGLAHVHEHMLFKGTERRAVGAIAAEIEAAGGDINAWTSFDQTVYHVTMASRDFDTGLDILADAVQHSSFDAEELAKELEVVLEEVRRGNDMPSRVVSQNLFANAFKAHPYRRPVIGYVDTVKSFTREKILGFYKRWYQPQNMCLVVVGDVDGKKVIDRAGELFSTNGDGAAATRQPRESEPAQSGLRVVRATKDVQETHLNVAWHGPAIRHEDTPALDVLTILLGSGESSRLYRRVKRDQQLVNDCYAYAYTPQDPGLVMLGANIHGDGVEAAFSAMLKEAFALRQEPPTAAEVNKAKTILLADAVYQKETVQGIARKIGFFELVAGDPGFEETYYAGVRKVTADDVRAVAERYLTPDGMTVSVLLPESNPDAMSEETVASLVQSVDAEADSTKRMHRFELGAEQVAKITLANGATLLVREDRAVPLVSVRAAACGGVLSEDASNNGVTHLTGELLVRGTQQYTAEQISEMMDATASGITGVSGRNSLGIRGDFLAESWDSGLDVFMSCLLEPAFAPEEIERERKTQIEDIASRQDSMSAVAFERFTETLWKSHPYRLPLMGKKASVESLTVEQIRDAYRTQLRPDRLTIAVVGAVDVPDTVDRFQRTIGAAKAHADARDIVLPPVEAPPESPRETSVAKNREQAHIVIGFPGIDIYDDRRWPVEVLTSVLAGQGGRLFLELRDKLSLAYSVTALSQEGRAPGYFGVYMGTAQSKLATAREGLQAELQKVLDGGVLDEEVERSKRYLVGTHEIALQRASARAGTMALNETYNLGWDDHLQYAARIEAVTAAKVHEVARDLIRFDRAVTSVVEVEE